MTTGTKIILTLIVVAYLIVIGLFFIEDESKQRNKPQQDPVPIVFSMDVDAERPFTARIFWTEDPEDKFSGKMQISKKVKKGKSHVTITIPTDVVHRLRLHFGKKPGRVSVSNLQISGTEQVTLNLERFRIFNKAVETHEIIDNKLVITSDLNGPYTTYDDPVNVFSD